MAMVLATAHATAHLLPVLRYGSLEESLQKVRMVIQVLATQVECNHIEARPKGFVASGSVGA